MLDQPYINVCCPKEHLSSHLAQSTFNLTIQLADAYPCSNPPNSQHRAGHLNCAGRKRHHSLLTMLSFQQASTTVPVRQPTVFTDIPTSVLRHVSSSQPLVKRESFAGSKTGVGLIIGLTLGLFFVYLGIFLSSGASDGELLLRSIGNMASPSVVLTLLNVRSRAMTKLLSS
jgi:hypothetical protein